MATQSEPSGTVAAIGVPSRPVKGVSGRAHRANRSPVPKAALSGARTQSLSLPAGSTAAMGPAGSPFAGPSRRSVPRFRCRRPSAVAAQSEPSGRFGWGADQVAAHLRRGAPVEEREVDAIEADETAVGCQPEVAVFGLTTESDQRRLPLAGDRPAVSSASMASTSRSSTGAPRRKCAAT